MSSFSGHAVTFEAGAQVFGLAIERVQEILHPSEIVVRDESSIEVRGHRLPLRKLAVTEGDAARVLVVRGDEGAYGLLVDRVRGILANYPDRDGENPTKDLVELTQNS